MSDMVEHPRFFEEGDGDLAFLRSRKVAVLGYGNQGRAQALNLRDSGIDVTVGLREGSASARTVTKDGLHSSGLSEAARLSDVIMILVPDEVQGALYREAVAPQLTSGKAIGFSHGFALTFGLIAPPSETDVFLVAPKGPGSALRANFTAGGGLPALVAAVHDASGEVLRLALAYAKGIGCLRCGALEVSAEMETEADLFGEQSVLCGGLHALAEAAFETLVEAGFPPDLAYIECVQEIKAMVDRLFELGPDGMWEGASGTARYGGLTRGSRLITAELRDSLREMLEDIRSGRFAREWLDRAERPGFHWDELHPRGRPVEMAGRAVRKKLKWTCSKTDRTE